MAKSEKITPDERAKELLFPKESKKTNKGAEEMAAETEDFDVEGALNTKGFFEFLARYNDSAKGEHDSEVIKERFEVFQTKNEISGEIKEIFQKEISAEIGINLSDKDLECVDEYLETEAIDNPYRLQAMQEQIAQYHELPKEIEAAHEELMTLTDNAEMAAKGTGVIGSIRMYGGLLIGMTTGKLTESRGIYEAQKAMKEKGVPINRESLAVRRLDLEEGKRGIEGEFAALQGEKMEALENLANRLANIKKELFAHAGLEEQITILAREKLKAEIATVAQKGGIKNINEAAARIGSKRFGQETELRYLDTSTEEDLKQKVDEEAEAYVFDVMYKKLDETKFGEKNFDNLTKSLGEVINAETIGTKNRQETRDFLISNILRISSEFPSDRDGNAKRIRANMLAKKLAAEFETITTTE